jgi:nucleotide-binding universal stress UspA family protein
MSVVVGFIPTPEGHAAVDAALQEARRRGTSLVVVHSGRGGPDEELDDVVALRESLAALERRVAGDGVPVEIRDLVLGHEPVEDILSVAKEAAAELIVIGLRRRSAVGKLLLGSNAQQILLSADCPVLAVKAPN